MRDRITRLILSLAEEQGPALPAPIETHKGSEACLYGPGGALDSLALVSFIVELETALEAQLGISVVLASERAVSQRRSPFLTVGSLAAFIERLMEEAVPSPGQQAT